VLDQGGNDVYVTVMKDFSIHGGKGWEYSIDDYRMLNDLGRDPIVYYSTEHQDNFGTQEAALKDALKVLDRIYALRGTGPEAMLSYGEVAKLMPRRPRSANPRKKKPASRVTKKAVREVLAKSSTPWEWVQDKPGRIISSKGKRTIELRKWFTGPWNQGWVVSVFQDGKVMDPYWTAGGILDAVKEGERLRKASGPQLLKEAKAMGAQALRNPRKKKPASRKKTLKGRAERAERKVVKGAKKAGRKAKKFAKTKEGYGALGAGAGALLLGPIGAVAGAVGGSALHDNPLNVHDEAERLGVRLAREFIRQKGGNAEDSVDIQWAFERFAAKHGVVYDGVGDRHFPPEAPIIMAAARNYLETEAGIMWAGEVISVFPDRHSSPPKKRKNPRRRNPSKGKHLAIADRKWNQFESSWDSFSISDGGEDLLAAYTAALEAELHYNHAGVDRDDSGRGAAPAGAEASGIEAQIYERLGR
jgi:hypothetical protein